MDTSNSEIPFVSRRDVYGSIDKKGSECKDDPEHSLGDNKMIGSDNEWMGWRAEVCLPSR